ncbi:hypothetical protein VCR4J5_770050 [Vibrio crassostreae]|uniref:Uncharacterized protein n=1 Tax=Vibrio crassostreae TaxID=246167 RepID=A0ABP1X0Z8_9VIBR|nr:hypothetical protein VCR4J5_770050 [Vibrio crassostreae]
MSIGWNCSIVQVSLADAAVGIRIARAKGKAKSTGFMRTTPYIKRATDNSTVMGRLNVMILLLGNGYIRRRSWLRIELAVVTKLKLTLSLLAL